MLYVRYLLFVASVLCLTSWRMQLWSGEEVSVLWLLRCVGVITHDFLGTTKNPAACATSWSLTLSPVLDHAFVLIWQSWSLSFQTTSTPSFFALL